MKAVLSLGALFAVRAQQAGTLQAEVHPPMTIQYCTKKAGCAQEQTSITVDESWRWTHGVGGYKNCLEGNAWVSKFCPNPAVCAQNCVVEGADVGKYAHDYGIAPVKGVLGSMELKYVAPGGAVASRVYLTDSDETYKVFKLKNKEFTMDVDVSSVPCGINAALYLIEMQQNGGKGIGHNGAGAKYGSGYCDAQCPRGVKFLNGEGNTINWGMVQSKSPSGKMKPDGPVGQYGACCAEMDIFEANRDAAAFTAHPCHSKVQGVYRCNGAQECGVKGNASLPGLCDKEGCGFNSWRMGDQTFYGKGPGFKVDTTKPMTVVTQFITADGTDTGDLSEIRRIWLQDGKVIDNSKAGVLGDDAGDSLTKSVCTAEMKAFETSGSKGSGVFDKYGGLKAMGEALDRGMVLSMSIWHDSLGRMLWLDGEKAHPQANASRPGASRGPCAYESGSPADLMKSHKDAAVTFMNIKYGEIGSTFAAGQPAAVQPSGKSEISDAGGEQETERPILRGASGPSGAERVRKAAGYVGILAAAGACSMAAFVAGRRTWRQVRGTREASPGTYDAVSS